MRSRIVGFIALTALLALSTGAFAYDFWGVTVGTASYDNSDQLTFDGLAASGVQYVVGGYKYTRVDSQWYGPFAAPSPGEGFTASRRSDAQGLFFAPDSANANFVVITTSCQTGAGAPEVGTGKRLFGPGDLKIDVDGRTYGVGLRLDNLLWAIDPSTTNPEFSIIKPDGTFDSIYARDAGTLGTVELNPRWARVGHASLPAHSDEAYAFFVSGSGTSVGSASVLFEDTGLNVGGAQVYAYKISVPWSVLGVDPESGLLNVSFRPDCGNDIISAQFMTPVVASVPEPGTMIAVSTGLAALLAGAKKK